MRYHASISCAIVFFALMESGFAQGIYLPAVGPVNRAMGGASVAQHAGLLRTYNDACLSRITLALCRSETLCF